MTALAWEGCVNVRDLGGHETVDARWTVPGRVVRSDSLARLTAAGWRALADHGVRRVVDLRWAEERADDPPRDVDVEVVHVSLLGEWTEEGHERHRRWREEAGSVETYLAESYEEFLELHRARFGEVLRAVADAPPGAVVFHCVAGKDRTGLVAALLLRLAGVPVEAVAADYALSEANLAPYHDEWVAAAPNEAEARRRAGLLPTPATAMVEVLRRLEERHGDVSAYLRGSGVGDDALERLRERLLG